MNILSILESSGEGVTISIEASLNNGLPALVLVGFGGKSLDESKERIKSAFSKSSIPLPKKRITINLSPSDIPKDGAYFDLAIALTILEEAKMIKPRKEKPIVLGELGLDGTIRPVRGVIGKLIAASKKGHTHFIIPRDNLKQSSMISGIKIHAADSLKSLYEVLTRADLPEDMYYDAADNRPHSSRDHLSTVDFSEIIGQPTAKRALEIAAAGGHNVLLSGPPGVGKSMLAKALPGILSEPSKEEILSITHLHSLTSNNITDLLTTRPFRSPHHSASTVSVIGGGQHAKPGEVSLAHCGVLFLDELPEFKRSTIESLRQPLEDGTISIARAKESTTYPAKFILVATQNPCPCGYYGSDRPCTCTPIELHRYQKKLSGPIIDRIDIHVTVDAIKHDKLLGDRANESEQSSTIQKRVVDAQNRQIRRTRKKVLNSYLTNKQIKNLPLESDAKKFLDVAADKLGISARVYMKVVKISQTIADLENVSHITKKHIAEALQYRPKTNV